jgi:hypothetical protein
MFAKIGYTWELMGASWDVLKRTKGLLVFPLLSCICCLLVMLSFALPAYKTGAWEPPAHGAAPAEKAAYYVVLFAFYFCNYFVITFFNTAIVAGAMSRMAGGEPSVAGCLRAAVTRIHLIVGWALLAATVGLILRIIEEQSEKVGRFVAGLLGMAWSMISFLVIPVLVMEEKGPLAALKQSTTLLKRTWGEQLVGNFSFGVVFFLLNLPAVIIAVIGIFLWISGQAMALAVTCIGAAIVYTIVLALIQSALQSIFQAAVYMHTQEVHAPGFPVKLLANAMSPRE